MNFLSFRGISDYRAKLKENHLWRTVTAVNCISKVAVNEDRVVSQIQCWMKEATPTRFAMMENDGSEEGKREFGREFGEKTLIDHDYLKTLSSNKLKLVTLFQNISKESEEEIQLYKKQKVDREIILEFDSRDSMTLSDLEDQYSPSISSRSTSMRKRKVGLKLAISEFLHHRGALKKQTTGQYWQY